MSLAATPLRLRVALALALAAAAAVPYAATVGYPFVSFDDPVLVYANSTVRQGLTWDGLRWAFGLAPKAQTYWHPLTWLSHMLDCQLFGLAAGWHHLGNVLLHAANVVGLFLLLTSLTGAPWRSALVAALLAVHPVNVESVAWVAGRKNLLSTSFWLLTVASHASWARRPSTGRYLRTAAFLALGLAAKPMLVTLPAILLLLDWWPLDRLAAAPAGSTRRERAAAWLRLAAEKLPLFVLAALAYTLSARTLASGANIVHLTDPGLGLRLANALVSVFRYLGTLVLPTDLIPFYPYPAAIPAGRVAAAAVGLVALSALALRSRRPWSVVGWLWFLVTLAPVSGLAQTGLWPALADRWAYVPQIGAFLVAAWAAAELVERAAVGRAGRAVVAGAVLLALAGATVLQVGRWRSNAELFGHTLAVDPDNYLGLTHLAAVELELGQPARARPLLERATRVNPASASAHGALGVALARLGELPAARRHLEQALALERSATTLASLGAVVGGQGDRELAVRLLQAAVELEPDDARWRNGLGIALAEAGRPEEALAVLEVALRLDPANPDVRHNLERCRRVAAERVPAPAAALSPAAPPSSFSPLLSPPR